MRPNHPQTADGMPREPSGRAERRRSPLTPEALSSLGIASTLLDRPRRMETAFLPGQPGPAPADEPPTADPRFDDFTTRLPQPRPGTGNRALDVVLASTQKTTGSARLIRFAAQTHQGQRPGLKPA